MWERWEIEKAMKQVYAANHGVVISDEIWSDIFLHEHQHILTQVIAEDARNRTIDIYAPTKAFNLAGTVGAYRIVYNRYLRDRMNAQASKSGYNYLNALSMYALLGAYSKEGAAWMGNLCNVLSNNVDFVWTYVDESFHGVRAAKPQGTYMLFLNCEGWCKAQKKHG